MRSLRLLIAAIALITCGELQPDSRALAPGPAVALAASATPVPAGVVDPAQLVANDTRLGTIVLRVDKVATKLTTMADALQGVSGASITKEPMWAIAIVGEISREFGVLATPPQPCAVFLHDATTGEGRAQQVGALALCQPYFNESLTPAAADVVCPSAVYDNGVTRTYGFSATRLGKVPLEVWRDDAWRPQTSVPGTFLVEAPAGSVPYQDAFCLPAFVRAGPVSERLLAAGVSAHPAGQMPSLDHAIWLRGYHALAARADAAGHIAVSVEARAGYEWAFFDWHALVPGGGYVMFQFVDGAGKEILPWRLANGP